MLVSMYLSGVAIYLCRLVCVCIYLFRYGDRDQALSILDFMCGWACSDEMLQGGSGCLGHGQ